MDTVCGNKFLKNNHDILNVWNIDKNETLKQEKYGQYKNKDLHSGTTTTLVL